MGKLLEEDSLEQEKWFESTQLRYESSILVLTSPITQNSPINVATREIYLKKRTI